MKDRYLEVTFRGGKPLAAYIYFPRKAGAKGTSTKAIGEGLLIDDDADGEPTGLEITAPSQTTLDHINAALAKLKLSPMESGELAPLEAA